MANQENIYQLEILNYLFILNDLKYLDVSLMYYLTRKRQKVLWRNGPPPPCKPDGGLSPWSHDRIPVDTLISLSRVLYGQESP